MSNLIIEVSCACFEVKAPVHPCFPTRSVRICHMHSFQLYRVDAQVTRLCEALKIQIEHFG